MAMTSSDDRGARSAINVTPLIDVLLVLLIIFMVIQPTAQIGLEALAPKQSQSDTADPDPRTVVVSVDGTPSTPTYAVNRQAVAYADLPGVLHRLVEHGGLSILFVQGSAALDYGTVAGVLDAAHAAGVQEIGVLTPAVLQQHG